jgi:hypothetical protein
MKQHALPRPRNSRSPKTSPLFCLARLGHE